MTAHSDIEVWSRRNFIGFVAIVMFFWTGTAFASLYLFSVPCMDNWCYFAPSVVARWPGNLTTPFLGSFDGADRIWGLQWPGVPLLNSILFSILPPNAALAIAWHVLLWLGVSCVLSWLTWLVSRSRLAATAALLFALCDRALSFIAGWQRMELLSLIIAAPLVAGLIRSTRREQPSSGQLLLRLVCTFVAPLTHPIAGALTAAVLMLHAWLGLSEKKARRHLVLQAVAFLNSVAALSGWFLLQPDRLSQFRDHAGMARTALVPGQIFLNSMREIYLPLPIGPLFYCGGLLLAFAVVIMPLLSKQFDRESPQSERRLMRALALLAMAIAGALQIFKNAYYIVFLLLPLFPLWAMAVSRLPELVPALPRRWQQSLSALLLLLIGIHGAFWITRYDKWRQAGFPNLRRELHHFWTTLPASQHLFIPEALWEEAAQSPKVETEILMNTIVNNSSKERRRAYEKYAYAKAQPGDILVIDDCQSNPPATAPDLRHWELINTTTRHLPGRMKWGFGFAIYRAR